METFPGQGMSKIAKSKQRLSYGQALGWFGCFKQKQNFKGILPVWFISQNFMYLNGVVSSIKNGSNFEGGLLSNKTEVNLDGLVLSLAKEFWKVWVVLLFSKKLACQS